MPKNGKDHLLSLRDGRQIFIERQFRPTVNRRQSHGSDIGFCLDAEFRLLPKASPFDSIVVEEMIDLDDLAGCE